MLMFSIMKQDLRKVDRNRKNPQFISCACGCGGLLLEFDDKGRDRKYLPHHHSKIVQSREKSHRWKGDNVGYKFLHIFMRRIKPKPDLCEYCGLVPPYDLANVSGIYNRDPESYRYLCRKCHRRQDKR